MKLKGDLQLQEVVRMLEYLRGNFRRECDGIAIDLITSQLYYTDRGRFLTTPLVFPAIGVGRRLMNGSYKYVVYDNGVQDQCGARVLCRDGLEYCWDGRVIGPGVVYVADYLLEEELKG